MIFFSLRTSTRGATFWMFTVGGTLLLPHALARSRLHGLVQSVRCNSSQKWLQRQKGDHFTRQSKADNLRSRAGYKLIEIDNHYKLFQPNKIQNVLDLGYAPGAWSQVARKRCHPHSMIIGVDIIPSKPPPGVHSIQANILSAGTLPLVHFYFQKHKNLDTHLSNESNLDQHSGYNISQNLSKREEDAEEYREVLSNDDLIPDSSVKNTKISPIVDIITSDMYVPIFQFGSYRNNLTDKPYKRLMNTSGNAFRDHVLSIDLCDAALVTAIDILKPNGSFVCKMYTGREDHLFEKRLRKVFRKVQRFKPRSSRSESREIYFVGLNKRPEIDKLSVFE